MSSSSSTSFNINFKKHFLLMLLTGLTVRCQGVELEGEKRSLATAIEYGLIVALNGVQKKPVDTTFGTRTGIAIPAFTKKGGSDEDEQIPGDMYTPSENEEDDHIPGEMYIPGDMYTPLDKLKNKLAHLNKIAEVDSNVLSRKKDVKVKDTIPPVIVLNRNSDDDDDKKRSLATMVEYGLIVALKGGVQKPVDTTTRTRTTGTNNIAIPAFATQKSSSKDNKDNVNRSTKDANHAVEEATVEATAAKDNDPKGKSDRRQLPHIITFDGLKMKETTPKDNAIAIPAFIGSTFNDLKAVANPKDTAIAIPAFIGYFKNGFKKDNKDNVNRSTVDANHAVEEATAAKDDVEDDDIDTGCHQTGCPSGEICVGVGICVPEDDNTLQLGGQEGSERRSLRGSKKSFRGSK